MEKHDEMFAKCRLNDFPFLLNVTLNTLDNVFLELFQSGA